MALGKPARVVDVDGKPVELEPKPSFFSKLFGGPKKQTTAPAPSAPQPPLTYGQNPRPDVSSTSSQQPKSGQPGAKPDAKKQTTSGFKMYLEGVGQKHKGLESALRAQGVKQSLYQFVRNMLIAAIILAIAIGVASFFIFSKVLSTETSAILLSGLIGVAVLVTAFQQFINYPTRKSKVAAKRIERDILFAARDLIISLRSGMPLFNAITAVSTGYGEASKEFAKIIEKVQLGVPLEDAIDQVVAETKSNSFRRIMLQAAVSIRAGADVTSAMQSIIDQLSQERVIELRRYGQRLNALAMFYMLFGIIIPSMGVAVLTIMTTFISIFTVNLTVLEFAVVGILLLQVIFLELIISSRPVFTM